MMLKVLFDNGVIGRSCYGQLTTQKQSVYWGPKLITIPVQGVVRKPPSVNSVFQAQIDAIFTIGRLVKEGVIKPFSSHEIMIEAWRGNNRNIICNSFGNNHFHTCSCPITRSKFRATSSFGDFILKGGKKDEKEGNNTKFSQLAFVRWLLELSEEAILAFKNLKSELKLTDFELASFDDLSWFKLLASKLISKEDFIDAFHLWTAKRNSIDVFLTLDSKFVKKIKRLQSQEKSDLTISTHVLQPLELLASLGIQVSDQIPLEYDRFYSMQDLGLMSLLD